MPQFTVILSSEAEGLAIARLVARGPLDAARKAEREWPDFTANIVFRGDLPNELDK